MVEQRERYEFSLVTQGKHRFYTLTMPSNVLAETCFVTTRDEDPKEGFQRLLDKGRAQEIARYIDEGLGTIPNSIVLSAQPEAALRVLRRGKTIEFRRTKRAFLILDGQHRVYGFSFAKTTLRVPVVIYNGLSRRDETRLFIDINTKQRPVPNELLLDIKHLAEYENDGEELMREIFDQFSADPASPLLGLMSMAEKTKGKISRVTFNASLKPIFNILSSGEGSEIYQILNAYLKAFLDVAGGNGSYEIITNPTVFRAVMLLFKDAAERVKLKHGKAYTVDHFKEVLAPVKYKTLKSPGKSYKSLYETLSKAIQSDFRL